MFIGGKKDAMVSAALLFCCSAINLWVRDRILLRSHFNGANVKSFSRK